LTISLILGISNLVIIQVDSTSEPDLVDEKSSQYTVTKLPALMRTNGGFHSLSAPRNQSTLKMYILFLIGLIILIIISYLALEGIEFNGFQTYIAVFNQYWINHPEQATYSLIIMGVVNLFWIIMNQLIEYLAGAREWIPPRKNIYAAEKKAPDTDDHSNSSKTDMAILQALRLEEAEFKKNRLERIENEKKDDREEYELILKSPILSPLAFLWIGVKSMYHYLAWLPSRIARFWKRLNIVLTISWEDTLQFIKDSWELFIYFLNPLNVLDEIIDLSITILVRFLFPSILTPVLFFLPIKYSFVFGSLNNIGIVFEVAVYFLLIGGLRVGVEFYSIYIRFLRNTRTYST